MKVDFGKTAADYSLHRAGFPDRLFDRLADFGIGAPGQRILDLGTGTGALARGFARRGAMVTALDVAPEMLAAGAELAAAEGLEVDFREGSAEATGLPDGSFDAVTAGQCWHWFDSAAAAAEARRLLRPEGRIALCHFDWLPLPGNVVAASEALIREHNPAWAFDGGDGFHGVHAAALAQAGFADIESFSFDRGVTYSHAAWRGRIRASAGVSGSLAPEAVAAFDDAHAALLAAAFPEDPLVVPHRCFALIARRGPDAVPAAVRG